MDGANQPDTSRNISRFFDTFDSHANPFGANRSADRAYRRAERIVAGVFLATKHLPAGDPLSTSARQASVRILEILISPGGEITETDSVQAASVRASVRYLISLLRMLSIAGSISMKNTGVLITALDEFCVFLDSAQRSSLSDSVSLSREDFLSVDPPQLKDITDKRVVRDKIMTTRVHNASDKPRSDMATSVRTQNILGILRTGRDLGIADIAANLPEYSTKMIQRELLELVSAGKVKKQGLKRWSRYSLSA
jgi:hypothetical protein